MAMSQDNQITLRGYVTGEPRFFQTNQPDNMGAEVRLGSTPRWLDRTTGEWREGEPSYYTVKCWRKLALNVKASLHKGDRVIVRGKFTTRTWTDNQQRPRADIEVEADTIGHDLLFGVSIFNRLQTARNVPEALSNGEIARAGLDSPDGQGADELPPVPDQPYGYTQDGNAQDGYTHDDDATGDAGDSFDGPGVPGPDGEAAMVGAATDAAAALPF
jgi:single-strand DNA-binding protein